MITIGLVLLQVSAVPIGIELRRYAVKRQMSGRVISAIDISMMGLLAVLTLSILSMFGII